MRKMLEGAKFIRELYERDEFKPILIQGDHGFGKTSYANCLISEVYSFKNKNKPYWNTAFFLKHLGFSPELVLKEWVHKKKRDYVYHWDDAGLWLHALDFQDPFVKDVGKYMQVARTDWGCVMFSTINIDDISSKIRGLRNAIYVDITKEGSSYKEPFKRTAVAYIVRKAFKGHEWKDYLWRDRFNCHVPDKFYSWYKPIRDGYAQISKEQAQKRWEEKKIGEMESYIRKIQMRQKVQTYMDKKRSEKNEDNQEEDI